MTIDPSSLNCCGVFAVHTATGVPFMTVWNLIKARRKRPNAWKGWTKTVDLKYALRSVDHKWRIFTGCKGLTVRSFAEYKARYGAVYLIQTSGHYSVVRDGKIIDQIESKPPGSSRNDRKRIKEIWIIS